MYLFYNILLCSQYSNSISKSEKKKKKKKKCM